MLPKFEVLCVVNAEDTAVLCDPDTDMPLLFSLT